MKNILQDKYWSEIAELVQLKIYPSNIKILKSMLIYFAKIHKRLMFSISYE